RSGGRRGACPRGRPNGRAASADRVGRLVSGCEAAAAQRKLPRVSGTDLERLADLAVAVGANVQPGQIVGIGAEYGHHDFVRALAASAYDRGAKFVDVSYFDPLVKRARIEFAPEDTLDFVPPWYGERLLELGRQRGAIISIRGTTMPRALDGLDPKRAGRDQLPRVAETNVIINERTVNWTVVAYPTLPWARLCYPDLDDD